MAHSMLVLICSVLVGGCGSVETTQVAIAISPEMPTTADDLVATITGGTGLAFRWSVNGGTRTDQTTNRIAAALTTKHETWKVEALQGATSLASAEVTIGNSPPVLPTVSAPTAPVAAAPIRCAIAAPPTDADGDAVTTTITWTRGGAPFTGVQNTLPNDTVPVQTSHTGDVFVCTVTATDPEGSTTATATATVAPRIAYMVNQTASPQVLQTVDLDQGTIADVGPLDVVFQFGDLAWDRINQKLYMIDGRGAKALYTVDTATGHTTLIGTHNLTDAFGLAFDPADSNRLYLTTAPGGATNTLYRMNTTTGAPTMVGAVGASTSRMEGLTYDSKRNQFLGATVAGEVFSINVANGAATLLGTASSMDDFGMTYDPLVDRIWAVDFFMRFVSIDPNASYASSMAGPNSARHCAIAIALPPP